MHKCDRCGKDINGKPLFVAMVADKRTIAMDTIGKMDLCEECNEDLNKLVEDFVIFRPIR